MGAAVHRLLTLALLAATCLTVCRSHSSEEEDGDWTVELLEKGCLPDDFSPTDSVTSAYQTCQSPGRPGVGGTLLCVAGELNLFTDTGFDDTAMDSLVDTFSSNQTWRQAQKDNLDTCQSRLNASLTPGQQGVYMLVCFKGMMELDCDVSVAASIGEALGRVSQGHRGACFQYPHLQPAPEVAVAFVTCANQSGVSLQPDSGQHSSSLEEDDADQETASSQEEDDGTSWSQEDDGQPTEQQVNMWQQRAEAWKQVFKCTNQATGQLSGDIVNWDTVLSLVDSTQGPQLLRALYRDVVEQCRDAGSNTFDQMWDCWNVRALEACVSASATLLAVGS